MKDVKAWGVSIGLHATIAAAFFVSFSFSHELLKKDDSKEQQKIQIESVFLSASNEMPNDNPKQDVKKKVPDEPKKQDVKEQKETPVKTAQNAPAKTAVQEQKKEESSNAASPPAQKKSSYSESDKRQFLAILKQTITRHIIYPETARRRSLSGEVGVSFVLLANGTLGNIRIDSGNPVFHKAAINAITSTKVNPPSSIPLPMELSLTLTFELDKA